MRGVEEERADEPQTLGRRSGHWSRDILLTVLLPPLGLVFTGAALFSARRRRGFSRAELLVMGALFVVGVALTLQYVLLLTTRTSYTTHR